MGQKNRHHRGPKRKSKSAPRNKPRRQPPQLPAANAQVASLLAAGITDHQAGRLEEAERKYLLVLEQQPEHPDALHMLGVVAQQTGRNERAVDLISQAIAVDDGVAEFHSNLALALHCQGRIKEALERYRRAIALKPNSAATYAHLGEALWKMGQSSEAAVSFETALSLQPDCAIALNGLGIVRDERGELDQASVYLERARTADPNYTPALTNLGNVRMKQGRLQEASQYFRQVLSLRPYQAMVHSNLLFCLAQDGTIAPESLFAEHCRWGEAHGCVPAMLPPHTNEPTPDRRLRIGYMSPDFRAHAVARFFEPVLAHHDPTQVETYCYAEVAVPDQTTARLQTLANVWQFTCGMADEELARKIYADRIDILVDLAGHTANNRLRVFAYKPAPVQATWIGYPHTTGLKQIDYRLTDMVMDPPSRPTLGTEELMWLRAGGCCFEPPRGAPWVNDLPALRNGYVTFGSLHRLDKLTPEVLDLWCRVLQSVPSARLLVFRDTLRGETQRRLEQEFVQRSIAASRLDLRHACQPSFYSVYNEIDISLDVLPWGGLTTSCDSLWMGVPFVTLTGDRFSSRMGAYLLGRVGLCEWIAHSTDEYVSVATRAASDLKRLAEVRTTLRVRMLLTVCDGEGVTRGVEEAYREMWRRWCARVQFAGSAGAS